MKSHIKNLSITAAIIFSFPTLANNILEISVNSRDSSELNKIANPSLSNKIYLNQIFNNRNIIIENKPQQENINNIDTEVLGASLILNKNEFVQIQGNDGIKKLFNGSIIIKFRSVPNLQNYALVNELEFVADISNIQRGVFKINNLYDLQSKINDIQTDENVLEVELQTFDPRQKLE